MAGLGWLLMAAGYVIGAAWWIAGIAIYWTNFSLPWQLAGFFAFPNLVLPFAVDTNDSLGRFAIADTPLWWVWIVGAGVLLVIGAALSDAEPVRS